MTKIWGLLILACLSCPAGTVLATVFPPYITLSVSGMTAEVSWEPVPGATGYTLYYAPYPYAGENTIGSLELGAEPGFSAELWPGAAYYVAVKARDGQGQSNYSNVEMFSLAALPADPALTVATLDNFQRISQIPRCSGNRARRKAQGAAGACR